MAQAEVAVSRASLPASEVPEHVLRMAGAVAVALIRGGKPSHYILSAEAFESLLEAVEDAGLACLANARRDEPRIRVSLSEL